METPVFDSIARAEKYADVFLPRVNGVRNAIRKGIVPSLAKFKVQYALLMAAVSPGGEAEEFASQLAVFIDAPTQAYIAEFATIAEDLELLMAQIHVENPELLAIDEFLVTEEDPEPDPEP